MPRQSRPIPADESYVDIKFPVRGLDVSSAFGQQRPDTTPTATNVRGYEASTGRLRGASRPGIAKFLSNQLSGSNPYQELQQVTQTTGTIAGSQTASAPEAIYYLTPMPNPTVLHRGNGITSDAWTYPHSNGAGDNIVAGSGDTGFQIHRIGAGTDGEGQVITAGALAATVSLDAIKVGINYQVAMVTAGGGYGYFLGQTSSNRLGVISYRVSTGVTASASDATWSLQGWTTPGAVGRIQFGNGAYTNRFFLSSAHATGGIFQVKAPDLDASLTYTVVSKTSIDAQVANYSFNNRFAQAGNILAILVSHSGGALGGLLFYNMSTAAFVYSAVTGITTLNTSNGSEVLTSDGTDFYWGNVPSGANMIVRKYSGTTGALIWTSATLSTPVNVADLGYVA